MNSQVLSETIQAVMFSLDNEETNKIEYYAIPIEFIKEIIEVPPITNIPNTNTDVLGMINLRDSLLPVIDLKHKIGLISQGLKENSKQKILVAELNKKLTGFIVDNVDEVMNLTKDKIEQMPIENTESANYLNGVIKVEDKLIVLLDVQKLLTLKAENNEHSEFNSIEDNFQEASSTVESVIPEVESDNLPDVLKEVFEEENSKMDAPTKTAKKPKTRTKKNRSK